MGSEALYSSAMVSTATPVLRYAALTPKSGWELAEGMMPESVLHDHLSERVRDLLLAWGEHRNVFVARNLAIRWNEARPAIGIDPDVCVFDVPPPDPFTLRSVLTWLPGHLPPMFALEVVSETKPRKDYSVTPEKYAASGTRELVIFDPLLAGPKLGGGPFRFQVWRRDEDDAFTRIFAGEGPAHASTLDAYFSYDVHARGLMVSHGRDGKGPWLTITEAAHARVAELEAQLRERG